MIHTFHPLGADGLVELGAVGDGALLGVALTQCGGCELSFTGSQGRRFRLIISSLVTLKADDFRQGNVVNKVIVYSEDLCPQDLFMGAYGYSQSEQGKYFEIECERLKGVKWSLLEVLPSYGCSLLAIFRGDESDLVIVEG